MVSRRTLSQLARRGATRAPRLRIVLICEGEKTEYIYFSLYTEALRTVRISLEIPPRECGTDPQSVIGFAISQFKDDKGIDSLFCVIDRDTHANFDSALARARTFSATVKGNRIFRTVASYPAFEYWLLLHFCLSTKPYTREGAKSPADVLISDLKKHLPGYEKNSIAEIASVIPLTANALRHSQITYDAAVESGSMNPSTEMHELVTYLLSFTPDPNIS